MLFKYGAPSFFAVDDVFVHQQQPVGVKDSGSRSSPPCFQEEMLSKMKKTTGLCFFAHWHRPRHPFFTGLLHAWLKKIAKSDGFTAEISGNTWYK